MTRGRRRTIVAGLVLAGWAFGLATVGVPGSSAAGTAAATPTVAAPASAATPATNGVAKVATATTAPAARGGTDAPFLRFGLIVMLGLALSGGAVVQYRATADAPPYVPRSRRPRRESASPAPTPATSAAPTAQTPPPAAPAPTMPSTPTAPAPESVGRAPVFSAFPRGERLSLVPAAQRRPQSLHLVEGAPRPSRAEGYCAEAIAAAYRYDRPATLLAFGAALDADPIVKPSALSDFWEMPAGGHADLAIAYLQRGQSLDARSIVTMALLTFPHHRELTALLREIDPYRLDRPA